MRNYIKDPFSIFILGLLLTMVSCKKENITEDTNKIEQPKPSEGGDSNLTSFSFENLEIKSWKFDEQYKIYTITIPNSNVDITKIKFIYPIDSHTRKPASGTLVDFSKPLHFQAFNDDATLNTELSSYIKLVKEGDVISNQTEIDETIFTSVSGVKELTVDNQKNEVIVTINKDELVDSLKTELNSENGIITLIEYDNTGKLNQNTKLIVIAEDGTVRKYSITIKQFEFHNSEGVIKYFTTLYGNENANTLQDTTYLQYNSENRLSSVLLRIYDQSVSGNILFSKSNWNITYNQTGDVIESSYGLKSDSFKYEYDTAGKPSKVIAKFNDVEKTILVKHLPNNIYEVEPTDADLIRFHQNNNAEVIKVELFYKDVIQEEINIEYDNSILPKEMIHVMNFMFPFHNGLGSIKFADSPNVTVFKHYPKSVEVKAYSQGQLEAEIKVLFENKLNDKNYPTSITLRPAAPNGSTSEEAVLHQFKY